jgi:hypothetical protein
VENCIALASGQEPSAQRRLVANSQHHHSVEALAVLLDRRAVRLANTLVAALSLGGCAEVLLEAV